MEASSPAKNDHATARTRQGFAAPLRALDSLDPSRKDNLDIGGRRLPVGLSGRSQVLIVDPADFTSRAPLLGATLKKTSTRLFHTRLALFCKTEKMLAAAKNEHPTSAFGADRFVCSLAAFPSGVENSRLGFAASESNTHQGSTVRNSWNALGLFADVRQNRIGFISYGDEITSTSNEREKFATYTRDGYTDLDYADQRYYASTYGRFNIVDPYGKSARVYLPMSWDRYAYCEDDPINCNDPTGLIDWGRVVLGTVQVVGGVAGAVGLGLSVPGTLLGSLPVVIPGAIAAGGAISMGVGNIAGGLTASGSTVSSTVSQGLNASNDLANAGGLLCGAASGGNSTAIQVCAGIATSVAFVTDAASVASASSGTDAATGILGVINDVSYVAPGPVVASGISITVTGTPDQAPYDPSIVPMQIDPQISPCGTVAGGNGLCG